jgi:predicted O-methyltransferase YrrM
MSTRTFTLPDPLYEYFLSVSLREPEILSRLRKETARTPDFQMQISPEQGQLMALLIRLSQATKILEIGVFTGYSSLIMALSLPHDGKIVACDISDEWTSVARRYWTEAGVVHKIDLRLAPALATLDSLLANGEAETFDFAFIDADKKNYKEYYERSLKLLRPGGVIAVDNVLWSGRVADARDTEADTESIREFNRTLHADRRIFLSLIPIGDGLTLALKR